MSKATVSRRIDLEALSWPATQRGNDDDGYEVEAPDAPDDATLQAEVDAAPDTPDREAARGRARTATTVRDLRDALIDAGVL